MCWNKVPLFRAFSYGFGTLIYCVDIYELFFGIGSSACLTKGTDDENEVDERCLCSDGKGVTGLPGILDIPR